MKPRTRDLVARTQEGLADVYLGYFVPHERDVVHMHRIARKSKLVFIYTTFETTRVPASVLPPLPSHHLSPPHHYAHHHAHSVPL